MGGEDVAEVGAVEYIFKRRKDSNPYRRTPGTWYEPAIAMGQLLYLKCAPSMFPAPCRSIRGFEGQQMGNEIRQDCLPASIEEYQPHPYGQ